MKNPSQYATCCSMNGLSFLTTMESNIQYVQTEKELGRWETKYKQLLKRRKWIQMVITQPIWGICKSKGDNHQWQGHAIFRLWVKTFLQPTYSVCRLADGFNSELQSTAWNERRKTLTPTTPLPERPTQPSTSLVLNPLNGKLGTCQTA